MAFGGTTASRRAPCGGPATTGSTTATPTWTATCTRPGTASGGATWAGSSRPYKDTDLDAIKDFAAYPELRWLDRNYLDRPVAAGGGLLPAASGGAAC